MKLLEFCAKPGANRLWGVGEAFRVGFSVKEVFQSSKIDPWFLGELETIIRREEELKESSLADLSKEDLLELKQLGFSDKRLATLLDEKESSVREKRLSHGG